MKVKKIGTVMNIDEGGCLINEADVSHITGKWKEVVDDTVAVYKKHLGDKLHSVYVRGSVARGTAIEGISDVDTEAILNVSTEELWELDIEWRKEEREKLDKKYPFQTGVEFYFISNENLSLSDRFTLQTQAVCVFGDDIRKEWEPIVFDDETIKRLMDGNDVEKKLRFVLEAIRGKDAKKREELLNWICKRFLRFGVLLAAFKQDPQNKKYTRDLYPSYELFAEQYPEKGEDMYRALEIAVGAHELSHEPAHEIALEQTLELAEWIEEFGGWLIQEKNDVL